MERIELDLQKIKGRMAEKNITQTAMAEATNMTPYSFSKKMHKKRDFKLSEVEAILNILEVTREEICSFFEIKCCVNDTKQEAKHEYIS